MFRKHVLAAGVALLVSSVPVLAAGGGHGGGGHGGGGHGGGGGGHGYGGGGYYGGHGGYYGGGVVLGLGFGGGGYYGGGYGGGRSYYGSGYSGGSYYGNGSGGGYYLPAPSVVAPYSVPAPTTNTSYPAPTPSVAPQIPLGASSGLKITELYEGTAKTAGLRKGDIILKVDGVRTQSFEELRASLSTGKEKVVVEYLDSTSGEADKRTVTVDGSKIGVSVSATVLGK